MFAFLVLSSSPGYEIKVFAIGLAAGIIFDATVIRVLLVPSLMKLLGDWNWWMPQWTRKALFVHASRAGARAGNGKRLGAPRVCHDRLGGRGHAELLPRGREAAVGRAA